MRFLIDECLHESLVGLAHAAGFEATHVNHLGLSGQPDWVLTERIIKDEFTFVTNNRADFIELFGKVDLHPGLIVLVPNVAPALQTGSIPSRARILGGRGPGQFRDRGQSASGDREMREIPTAREVRLTLY
jgi:predicted nuclease of predicted toxin-antitoxin system